MAAVKRRSLRTYKERQVGQQRGRKATSRVTVSSGSLEPRGRYVVSKPVTNLPFAASRAKLTCRIMYLGHLRAAAGQLMVAFTGFGKVNVTIQTGAFSIVETRLWAPRRGIEPGTVRLARRALAGCRG